MGSISKKLGRRFSKWSGQFRRSVKTVLIPKDVRDVGTLVKDGHDPLHAVYISVQNITSVFSECVSVMVRLPSTPCGTRARNGLVCSTPRPSMSV